MSREVSTNGEERRIHNGTQTGNGSTPEQNANEDRSDTPPRPQSEQQQYREPCTFCKQWGAQATRSYGEGSALKPSHEPICLARKPLEGGTLASNYLKHGTGGINIDGCRVETHETIKVSGDLKQLQKWKEQDGRTEKDKDLIINKPYEHNLGRFPANLIHDGSDEVKECFPETKSGKMGKQHTRHTDGSPNGIYGKFDINHELGETYGDSVNAPRFFKSIIYQAKASKSERNKGCEGRNAMYKNNHPTVKPVKLMEYLVKLVSRENATVLDPFAGSGTTGIACKRLSRNFIGIELSEEYCEIAKKRIEAEPLKLAI